MLLTKKQQLFLIYLLEKPMTNKEQFIFDRHVLDSYTTQLEKDGLIKIKPNHDGTKIFELTRIKGNIMARFFAGLLEDKIEYTRFEKYAIV